MKELTILDEKIDVIFNGLRDNICASVDCNVWSHDIKESISQIGIDICDKIAENIYEPIRTAIYH